MSLSPSSSSTPSPLHRNSFRLELIGGLFGLLGLGYLYVGWTQNGLIRLLVGFAILFGAYSIIGLLVEQEPLFCLCVPLFLIIQIGLGVTSARQLRTQPRITNKME